MNSYFNNLALRSMNAGNLVEPRLPSLFEPQRDELEANTPVYSEPRQASPASIDAPPTPLQTEPKVSIEEPRVTEEVIERQQSAVTTTTVPPPSMKSDEPQATTQTATVPQTAQAKTEKSTNRSVQSVLPQPDKAVHSEEVKATTSAVEEERVSLVEEEEEQQVFFEPAPTFETPTLFKTEVKPQLVERVVEKSRNENSRDEKSRTERFRNESSRNETFRNTDKTDFRSVTRSIANYAWRESDTPEPEPSINITIGRVEVRAALATDTKPTRTKQESPVMPLEEYLRKQRRGGER